MWLTIVFDFPSAILKGLIKSGFLLSFVERMNTTKVVREIMASVYEVMCLFFWIKIPI